MGAVSAKAQTGGQTVIQPTSELTQIRFRISLLFIFFFFLSKGDVADFILNENDLLLKYVFSPRTSFKNVPYNNTILSCYMTLQVLYDNKVLGRFCGHKNSADGNHPGSEPIWSPGNTLTLVFRSDESKPNPQKNVGFSAQYQAIGNTRTHMSLSMFVVLICIKMLKY